MAEVRFHVQRTYEPWAGSAPGAGCVASPGTAPGRGWGSSAARWYLQQGTRTTAEGHRCGPVPADASPASPQPLPLPHCRKPWPCCPCMGRCPCPAHPHHQGASCGRASPDSSSFLSNFFSILAQGVGGAWNAKPGTGGRGSRAQQRRHFLPARHFLPGCHWDTSARPSRACAHAQGARSRHSPRRGRAKGGGCACAMRKVVLGGRRGTAQPRAATREGGSRLRMRGAVSGAGAGSGGGWFVVWGRERVLNMKLEGQFPYFLKNCHALKQKVCT